MFLASGVAYGQQGPGATPLSVSTGLPKAHIREAFQTQLDAKGGTAPYSWQLTSGDLPPGLVLDRSGLLSGTPSQSGNFQFTLTVTDSSKPGAQVIQQFELRVVAPLMLQWNKPPKVNGRRIEGSVVLSNETEHDVDLTVVVLAVNEIGRATAIGYQHLQMKKDTSGLEVPFGENLPTGTYQLNVDAVAESPSTNSINRARLVQDAMRIDQGP
jgi:hypothetical protein